MSKSVNRFAFFVGAFNGVLSSKEFYDYIFENGILSSKEFYELECIVRKIARSFYDRNE